MKVSDKIMKQFPVIAMALLTIFAFEACKVGPGFKAQRNEIDSTAVYRYDSLQLAMTDSVLNISWWDLFDDPIIDTLIRIGLKENKDVLIASSRIEQAQIDATEDLANQIVAENRAVKVWFPEADELEEFIQQQKPNS